MIKTVTFDDTTHKVVPLEPTEEMLEAANKANHAHDPDEAYLFERVTEFHKAMISAAPELPAVDKLDENKNTEGENSC